MLWIIISVLVGILLSIVIFMGVIIHYFDRMFDDLEPLNHLNDDDYYEEGD